MKRRVLRAWIDAHIGWHQGRAGRVEIAAQRHRDKEARWRDQYEQNWPNPYRGALTRVVADIEAAQPSVRAAVAQHLNQTTPPDPRDPKPCPKCGVVCTYDGWGHVHSNGLGIGRCTPSTSPGSTGNTHTEEPT